MKIKTAALIVSLGGMSFSSAATGFFGDHIIVANGINYKAIGSGAPQLSEGLGTFPVAGSLTIQGFQLNTWEDNGSVITHMNLFWTVDNFAHVHQIQINPAPAKTGNDRFWSISSATQNVLTNNGIGNLGVGNYTFQAYWEGYTNGTNTAGNIFQSNSGNNYTASFTVVPEPSAALLGGLGMMALLRRRRF